MKRALAVLIFLAAGGCPAPRGSSPPSPPPPSVSPSQPTVAAPWPPSDSPYVVVLGVAQDAGYPQAACRRACCARAWDDPSQARWVASLGIVDPRSGRRYLIDCTPDFRAQLHRLDGLAPVESPHRVELDGVFLTHAHIGHYTGLMQLGREVTGSQGVPVWAMPRMSTFLREAGPWSQLVELRNVSLRPLVDGQAVELAPDLKVTPFLVPHRDEFSETVGFRVQGPNRTAVWLPDIDKWERWSTPVEELLAGCDLAYLDGTFFAEGEIPNRAMADIPHPFVVESIERFAGLPPAERAKVRFVHLNHSNPALDPTSPAVRQVEAAGHAVAQEGEVEGL